MVHDANEEIPSEFIEDVCSRLGADQRVRKALPGGGRLNIDRLLPFLCVYRRNPRRQDAGTRLLVNGEAAYLNAPGDALVRKGLRKLVRRIAETATAKLGAFLIVEIWSAPDSLIPRLKHTSTGESLLPRPAFRILERLPNRPDRAVNSLKFSLQRITLHKQPADVEVVIQASVHPPGLAPLLSSVEARRLNCYTIGLEILPVYRDGKSGELFPQVLRQLHRGVGRALKKAFFAFALNRTNSRPQHFYALGRRTLARNVWEADHRLAEIGAQFNLLWQVTPVNAENAWREFQQSGFQAEPAFQYRPLGVDPLILKRQLNRIATERIEDPTLAHVFRQTQEELDRLITMLADIGTPRFLPGSLQVYGAVEPSLLALAHGLLEKLPPGRRTREPARPVDARTFAKKARAEIRYYQQSWPQFTARAQIRDDMFSGLISSSGSLLIGRDTSFAAQHVDALLQHEVGTHLVTYYNGLAQPLRLLATGLAGYDALQEGLAVLAEYLAGGLSSGRLRLLAGRVVAAHRVVRGASFRKTYHTLVETHRFEPRTAYTVTLRVYRGGGLTKDAVYLRGLVEILDFLRRGGDLEPLLVGKLAIEHVPIMRELLLREVLRTPPLRPRFMTGADVTTKLQRLRQGMSVLELADALPAATS